MMDMSYTEKSVFTNCYVTTKFSIHVLSMPKCPIRWVERKSFIGLRHLSAICFTRCCENNPVSIEQTLLYFMIAYEYLIE